jgi:hypothetical protein
MLRRAWRVCAPSCRRALSTELAGAGAARAVSAQLEPVVPRAAPRPGEADLRRATSADVSGHVIFYRDTDGERRCGVVRESKGRDAWVTDHENGISVVHYADIDSFWRLKKPLRGPSKSVRRELSSVLARVGVYAAGIEARAEGAWATLLPAAGSSERLVIRDLRDLAAPLLGLAPAASPTNLQLIALHTTLAHATAAASLFKAFGRGLAFAPRPAEAVARAREAVAANAAFALSPPQQLALLQRLRECVGARDAARAHMLADAERESVARAKARAEAVGALDAKLLRPDDARVELCESAQSPAHKLQLYTIPTTLARAAALASTGAAQAARGADGLGAAIVEPSSGEAAARPADATQPDAARATPDEPTVTLDVVTATVTPDAVTATVTPPFGAECALERRALDELRRFALCDEFDDGYATHEPLVSLLLWPLTRRDRPVAAFELLVRLGRMSHLANLHTLRAVQAAADALGARAQAAAHASAPGRLEPAPPGLPPPPPGLLEPLPDWAVSGLLAPPASPPAPALYPPPATERHRLVTVTIDGADAEEIDDGVSAERAADGAARVWVHVHIANPTLRIAPYSALDQLALSRGRTLYLPEGSSPMLPAAIARGADGTGLEPTLPAGGSGGAGAGGAPRSALTFSALVDEASGALLQYRVSESELPVVLALTYPAADVLLASANADGSAAAAAAAGANADTADGAGGGAAGGGVVETLRLLEGVARARRARRLAAGALALSLPKPNPRVDLAPAPAERARIAVASSVGGAGARSAALVEEMMILAGEVCAELAVARALPLAFRAQLLPADRTDAQDEALRTLRELTVARAAAQRAVSPEPSVSAQTPHLLASVGVLPLLRPATVSTAPDGGHASLGLRAYAQVTSPLRRYLDLIAHHQIRATLAAEAGALEGVPLDDARFAAAAAALRAAEADGVELAPSAPRAGALPYSALEVRARIGSVGARSAQLERLQNASSRYWTLQFLAQQARDGVTDYDALSLSREEHPINGTQVLVLLRDLGFRTWLREFDCEPGTELRVRVRKVHAHRNSLQLVPA